MESVHELVEVTPSAPVPHLELVQGGQPAEIDMIRCPSCDGLRPVSKRAIRAKRVCLDCRKGNVVYREDFYDFWTETFTMDEIREMSRDIWG